MNEMIEMMLARHSIRRFKPEQISEAELEQILAVALNAPSAGNNQYSRIVVSQDAELNEKLGRMSRALMFGDRDPADMKFRVSTEQPSIVDDHSIMNAFYNAPTVVTIFTRGGKYGTEDAAMISMSIQLAAHALGIGSCQVGRADEVFETEFGLEVRKKWGIPEDMKAICNIALGYRDGEAPHAKPRKEGRVVRV